MAKLEEIIKTEMSRSDSRTFSKIHLFKEGAFLCAYEQSAYPFEDGNGRIARLMVNFILARHGYPMIVVRSRKKIEYLEALHATDQRVGFAPSDGAHASITDIGPFLTYFNRLVATEVYNDYLFVTERNGNYWWYDGELIKFRSPNYAKILRMMQSMPIVTLKDIQKGTGINASAAQKLLNQLIEKNFIERNLKDRGWRVVITPSI